MKYCIFPAIIFCLISQHSTAAIITATANGNWTSPSTWNLNRVPANNDNVVIPVGRTVFFQNTPYAKNDVVARPTLNIDIMGTLDFSNAGNDKLYLGEGSTIEIFGGGLIQTTSTSSEIIAIYNGASDNTVWTGSPSSISGPKSATGTSVGFTNALLPIALDYFEAVENDDHTARLIWQTSQESNTSHFEIERTDNASGKWNLVGSVSAAGNSSVIVRYEFLCDLTHGLNQFRLKQIDLDGKFSYSPIRAFHLQNSELKVVYLPASRTLYLKGASEGKYQVKFYTLSGSLVQQGSIAPNQAFQVSGGAFGMAVLTVFNGRKLQYTTLVKL
jgi:hypothetical protein